MGGMDAESFMLSLTEHASAKIVFAGPVSAHGRTVVTVAKVPFGGGYGARDKERFEGGGGGGVSARPAGYIEVGPEGARYVSITPGWTLAAAAVGGASAGWLLARRR